MVGNLITRPISSKLFGAAVCQVPLLDMKAYSHLLAGASWMAEYGDPDKPEEWKTIQTYSPVHMIKPGESYPRALFTTSTKDDRVHPGHARKVVLKLAEETKCDVWYYENIEGGHSGAADNKQRAFMKTLEYLFLWETLGK